MNKYIAISIKEKIKESININGIEGTEEIIRKTYSHKDSKHIKELYLKYYKLKINLTN